jgi:hypothetical protein
MSIISLVDYNIITLSKRDKVVQSLLDNNADYLKAICNTCYSEVQKLPVSRFRGDNLTKTRPLMEGLSKHARGTDGKLLFDGYEQVGDERDIGYVGIGWPNYPITNIFRFRTHSSATSINALWGIYNYRSQITRRLEELVREGLIKFTHLVCIHTGRTVAMTLGIVSVKTLLKADYGRFVYYSGNIIEMSIPTKKWDLFVSCT